MSDELRLKVTPKHDGQGLVSMSELYAISKAVGDIEAENKSLRQQLKEKDEQLEKYREVADAAKRMLKAIDGGWGIDRTSAETYALEIALNLVAESEG